MANEDCSFPDTHAPHPWGWIQDARRPRRCSGIKDPSGAPPLPIDPTKRAREVKRRERLKESA